MYCTALWDSPCPVSSIVNLASDVFPRFRNPPPTLPTLGVLVRASSLAVGAAMHSCCIVV